MFLSLSQIAMIEEERTVMEEREEKREKRVKCGDRVIYISKDRSGCGIREESVTLSTMLWVPIYILLCGLAGPNLEPEPN